MDSQHIKLNKIRIPRKHHRIRQDDGSMVNSLSVEGLKDPIIVVSGKGEYILADGYRRLKAARKLRWETIEASVREPGEFDPDAHASLLRLTVNHHRQGFYPSQRAHYLKILTKKYGVSINEIAEACGVSASAAKLWMAVNDCTDEIQMFIDDGKFPLDSSKLIKSLKPAGQMMVASKFRDRPRVSLGELKTFIKKIHQRHPEHIRLPLKSNKPAPTRRKVERKAYGRYTDFSLPELESKIVELEKEITFMRREIIRAIPIIEAICKNGKLRLALPGNSLKKFESFLMEMGHG